VGSTLFLTDDAGAVTDTYAYSPYGEVIAETGGTDNPFTWHGRLGVLRDGELYSMRARWYDSVSARFLSRDPIRGIDPVRVNPYQALFGDPLSLVDPLGTDPDGLDLFIAFETADKLNSPLIHLVVLLTKNGLGVLGDRDDSASEAHSGNDDDGSARGSGPAMSFADGTAQEHILGMAFVRLRAAANPQASTPGALAISAGSVTNVSLGQASFPGGPLPASNREFTRRAARPVCGDGAMPFGGPTTISNEEWGAADWIWFGVTPAGKLAWDWYFSGRCPPHPATGAGCTKKAPHPGLHVNNGWGQYLSWP
jgi:RHS repeat-associated protein